MKIGYSDDVVVFLNGHPICAGNNSIGARGPEFLGLLSVNDDAVYLPLKKGDNELVLAVTEFFGEWIHLSDERRSTGAERPGDSDLHHPYPLPKRAIGMRCGSAVKSSFVERE